MKKSIKVKSKKRGRPATGKDPLMGFRAPPALRASVVKWAENQPDKPGLSESVRRLVEIGLTVRTKSKQPTTARAERAKILAWKTLESLTPGAAGNDEKTSRKRRLVKGPEEFQGVRIDQPPAPSGKKSTRSD